MKFSPVTWLLTILCIILYLLIPVKLCQIICLSIFFIILFSFLYALNIKYYLKIERTKDELKLFCNETTEISLSVKNYSKLPIFTCHFLDNAAGFYVTKKQNTGLLELRPRENKKIKYEIKAQERGSYFIGPVILKFYDPLFLFTIDKEINSTINIKVRPRRIKLITKTVPGFPQGNLKINNICYEDITMRRSINEYKTGDNPKRINWKISAKYEQLYINEFESSYDAPIFVFLNLAEDDYDIKSRTYDIEKAIEIAASIVEKARILKQRIGFTAYAKDFPYIKPEKNQSDSILDLLAIIEKTSGNINSDSIKTIRLRLPKNTLFYYVGPEEVSVYNSKINSNTEDINTENTRIRKI